MPTELPTPPQTVSGTNPDLRRQDEIKPSPIGTETSEMEKPVAPWEISAHIIAENYPGHLPVAEVVFFTRLLREFNDPDNPIRRYMKSERMGKTAEGMNSRSQEIAQLIDHYRALQTETDDGSEKKSFRMSPVDIDPSLESAMIMLDDGYIRPMRNDIFAEAVDWKPHDAKRALSKASLYLRLRLPDDQLLHIKEATGFVPPSIGKTLFQYGASTAYNIISASSLETTCVSVGALAVTANPLRETDAKVATALVFASYIPWLFAAYKNSDEMWKMLEETGVCSSVTAKVCFEWAKRKRPEDIEFQKKATFAGAMFWQVALELPYYAGALLTQQGLEAINQEYDQRNGWKSGIIGANLTAAIHNTAQIVVNRGLISMYCGNRYPFMRMLGRTSKPKEKQVL